MKIINYRQKKLINYKRSQYQSSDDTKLGVIDNIINRYKNST